MASAGNIVLQLVRKCVSYTLKDSADKIRRLVTVVAGEQGAIFDSGAIVTRRSYVGQLEHERVQHDAKLVYIAELLKAKTAASTRIVELEQENARLKENMQLGTTAVPTGACDEADEEPSGKSSISDKLRGMFRLGNRQVPVVPHTSSATPLEGVAMASVRRIPLGNSGTVQHLEEETARLKSENMTLKEAFERIRTTAAAHIKQLEDDNEQLRSGTRVEQLEGELVAQRETAVARIGLLEAFCYTKLGHETLGPRWSPAGARVPVHGGGRGRQHALVVPPGAPPPGLSHRHV
jgi:hypothetical protein